MWKVFGLTLVAICVMLFMTSSLEATIAEESQAKNEVQKDPRPPNVEAKKAEFEEEATRATKNATMSAENTANKNEAKSIRAETATKTVTAKNTECRPGGVSQDKTIHAAMGSSENAATAETNST